jgi:UDP-GlcNAc:undecaprenyl-phosphate GlcNAc-1-phosphate transferase
LTPFLAVGGAAALLGYFLTLVVRAIAKRVGAYAVPRDRKVHRAPTPTLGGLAVYAGFVAAFGVAGLFPSLRETFSFSEVFGLLLGGLIVLVLGIVDDRYELSPPAKLPGQIFAGGIVYLSGIQMSFFWLPGVGVISLSGDVSAILTIFWIVLLTNAVNYIDGLDGLAVGLSAIAAAAIFSYSRLLPSPFLGPAPLAPLVAVALAGVCIGFLPLNFYPARIMLGDAGAMPLGLFLAGATISMIGRFNGPGDAGGRVALPLIFTPIVFLALPVTNFVFVTGRRLLGGQALMKGRWDEHIHYRLLRLGHSQRQAVLVMWGWGALLSSGLVVAGRIPSGRFYLAFAIGIGTVVLLTLAPRLRSPHRSKRTPQAAFAGR